MFQNGSKLQHVKATNFIEESVDGVNIMAVGTSNGEHKITMLFSRNSVEVSHETFVDRGDGHFEFRTEPDAVKMSKLVFANLTMSHAAAQGLVTALQRALEDQKSMQNEQEGQ